jgi:isopentenyldiphosphate isomerase
MSKSETLATYMLDNIEHEIPMDRKEFYVEQVAAYKEGGEPTRACDVVQVFLFNTEGELAVQKRSASKNHNPNLLDKSIGGHMKHGDLPDYTVAIESIQELQTPSVVLRNDKDFRKTFEVLQPYLATTAVIKYATTRLYKFEKIISGETIVIANKAHIYLGVYDGPTRPVDRESKGILYYTLEDLRKEIEQFPTAYTWELRKYLEDFGDEMEEFVKGLK